ncbi:MAG: hypothetical protein HZB52_16210 [Chloroflexi bacterium]|nr:hypothetical protein [Chloroflexota bacterium]
MPFLSFTNYLTSKPRFAVTRAMAQAALAWAQPLAMETLGIHTQRQTLVEGELPAYIVMTNPETNGGWGELMPVWFKPYERPVPLYCLDNWTMFALLYRSSFGEEANVEAFNIENILRVVIGADLLIPFLPGTDGAGRFLRHGAMPILLSILWLEPDVREAWLAMHARGARKFAEENRLEQIENVSGYLERIENEAFLVPEQKKVVNESAARSFLDDATSTNQYRALFGGLCLSVASLAAALSADWRRWSFQAVNVGYRTTEFGVTEIGAWLKVQ